MIRVDTSAATGSKVIDIKIAYIGGGSRGWAWRLMADFAMEEALSGTFALYDIDKEAARRNAVIGNRLSAIEEAVGKWDYVVADSLEEAVTGSDFVIISILPGTFDEMEIDVHMPERLGVWQSVGDTVGPGGIVRALRTIPMIVEIAEAVREYAPEAWVINYTNPMALCVRALYHTFPEIKAFGCCHEVFGTQKILKNMCEERLGMKDVKRNEIIVNVLGINHFTWFSEASCRGVDLFPVYREFVAENNKVGLDKKDENWMNELESVSSKNLVKFDLFERYGWIAAAGDRHLAEFMPGDEYLKNPDTVTSWGYKLTTVKSRKEDLKKRMDKSDRLLAGEDVKLKPSGEEGVALIKALLGLGRFVSNVNIPNTYGQIPNLPADTVVETNAVFARDSIKPVVAGNIKPDIRELIMPHAKNQDLILKAALNCEFEPAFEAMMADPNISAKCRGEQVMQLLRDMISETAKYLPEKWKID